MPIVSVTEVELEQRCAACAHVHRVALSTLQVGVGSNPGATADPYIVPLPACPGCAAHEFLVRTHGLEPEMAVGTYSHRHRLLVDHVHARLVVGKQVIPALDGDPRLEALARTIPTDELSRWFPDGLRLDA